MPKVAREIDSWDLLDQLVYTEEWPLEIDRLAQLEDYAKSGHMTEAQLARYDELKALVSANTPLLERILEIRR